MICFCHLKMTDQFVVVVVRLRHISTYHVTYPILLSLNYIQVQLLTLSNHMLTGVSKTEQLVLHYSKIRGFMLDERRASYALQNCSSPQSLFFGLLYFFHQNFCYWKYYLLKNSSYFLHWNFDWKSCFLSSEMSEKIHNSTFQVKISV